MKKLKYVKLFENFIDHNVDIESMVNHMVEYGGEESTYKYKYGRIFAGQNVNFQQYFTPFDENSTEHKQSLDLVGQSEIDVQYFIGSEDGKGTLNCYNPIFPNDKNGKFLGCFNRQFKTNYRTLQKRNKNGSVIGDLYDMDK